jgi:hypothetical protein
MKRKHYLIALIMIALLAIAVFFWPTGALGHHDGASVDFVLSVCD